MDFYPCCFSDELFQKHNWSLCFHPVTCEHTFLCSQVDPPKHLPAPLHPKGVLQPHLPFQHSHSHVLQTTPLIHGSHLLPVLRVTTQALCFAWNVFPPLSHLGEHTARSYMTVRSPGSLPSSPFQNAPLHLHFYMPLLRRMPSTYPFCLFGNYSPLLEEKLTEVTFLCHALSQCLPENTAHTVFCCV